MDKFRIVVIQAGKGYSSIVVKVGNVRYTKQGLSKRVMSIGEADLVWVTRWMNGEFGSHSITSTQ